jgi:hypothetical protein
MLRTEKIKDSQGGTICIKKNTQMSRNFLIQGKIRNIKLGPREEQDGYPSHGIPLPSRGVPPPSCGILKISGGMTSFSSHGISFRRHGFRFCERRIKQKTVVMNYIKTTGPI